MEQQEIELSIGDTFQVGDYFVTVIDIEGDEISVKIETELGEEINIDELHVSLPQ